MNWIKKTTLFAAATLMLGLFSLTSNAQQVKFAHIDYLKVVDSLPTMMEADKQVEMFLKAGEKTILEMETALQADYDAYMVEKPTLSDVMQELREKQLMEQQQIIEMKKQSLQQDLEILNDRLYKPIEDNLVKAIETVATKHGITYMLEKNSMLYTSPTGGLDLTKEVKAELIRLENLRTAP